VDAGDGSTTPDELPVTGLRLAALAGLALAGIVAGLALIGIATKGRRR